MGTVLVVGTGTIGEPLITLLTQLKSELGIDRVLFHKRSPEVTDRPKVREMVKDGAVLVVDSGSMASFEKLGMKPRMETWDALDQANVVIDATPKGVGLNNKKTLYKEHEGSTAGFIAQGSEFRFGKQYARGINDRALVPADDKYIQVVSCNTHNLSIIADELALSDGGPENLERGTFVCMRRSTDISQKGGISASPEPGKHKDERFGTHHARDAWHLFNTLEYDLNIFSSAIKLNTQYMHTLFFDMWVKNSTTREALLKRIEANERMAVTFKSSAGEIFSFGRDHGHYGRILNVTVMAVDTLAVLEGGHRIVGYCFTPQDGNSLLSSVSAAMWRMFPDDYEERIKCLQSFFYQEV